MAEVYLGRHAGDEGWRKSVALKVIRPHLSEIPRFRDLFTREARIAASLSHPNLVQVFDFGRTGRSFFLAMEYVEGWTLAQALSRARLLAAPVPRPVWRYWMEGILTGIGHLHARGIVHRDISPSNILLSREGAVKVTDLGIARSLRTGRTEPASREGKPAYMSPEQARGEEGGASSDLFAAALVAAEMFLPAAVLSGGGEEPLARLRRFDPAEIDLTAVPAEIAAVARRGLAARAEDRFLDAEDFLLAVCGAVPVSASRPDLAVYWDTLFPGIGEEETEVDGVPPGDRADRVREPRGRYGGGRRRALQGALAALVVLSAGGAAFWNRHRAEPPRREASPAPVPGPAPSAASPESAPGKIPAAPPAGRGEKAAATVLLETDPPGVSVSYGDGTPLGKTPLRIDAAGAAGEEIVFEREGYHRRKVRAGSIAALPVFRLEMERQTGTVDVIQAIPWGKVYLGNRLLGETPISSVTLPVGRHRLRVVNEPLGVEKTVTVEVRPGRNGRLIVPLVDKP